MARRDEEYDWLDDPFNEQKNKSSMGGGSKVFVGIGCLAVVVLIIVLVIVGVAGIVDVASTM